MYVCIKCGRKYPKGSKAIINGCECGSRFFSYEKKEVPREIIDLTELTPNDREKRKEELEEIIAELMREFGLREGETFDIETIRVRGKGIYEVDIQKLLSREPIIVAGTRGIYRIDLVSLFRSLGGRSNEKK